MKALSLTDELFLVMERRQQPMHVGGLQVFKFPEGAGKGYVLELAEAVRAFRRPASPFNQRLVTTLGQFFWDEDRQFDLDHHFRHEALPHPGRIRELLALVSVEHSVLLDRERPLWEVHLIEGLAGRRFALYTKVHHSLVDGVAAMRLLCNALSADPDARNLPPIWAQPTRRRRKVALAPTDLMSQLVGMSGAAGRQLSTLPGVVRAIYDTIRKARSSDAHVSLFQAPRSILNQSITGSRRFAAQSWSLPRFKAIAKVFGSTLNDVVLAVCGGALRHYLLSQRALPDQPLIAFVPMSLRLGNDGDGNQVAAILANLATHVDDPMRRMEIVIGSVREAKERCARMTPEEILNYTALTLAPGGLNLLTGINPEWQGFNVVISNVPGPKEPMYWNGARLQGTYPLSIVLDRLALNITLTSYVDSLEFGIIACRRALPSMQRLLDYIELSVKELESAARLRD